MVRLAAALPAAFPGTVPLSVDEAADALRDSWFTRALARAAAGRTEARSADARGEAMLSRPEPAAARPGPDVPVLCWEDGSVTFGDHRAVDNVTLSVADGEWVALIGANGSGKSTLTGLAVGLGTPSAGVVRFRGRPVRPGKVFEHAAKVALLLQAADEMLFETTVQRELAFGLRFRTAPEAPVLDVDGALEFFGFRGLEQASPWELSQGGRQRLALAALLVGAPGVLVLDEPTTGQDADHMRAFLGLLDRIRERTGLTIVTVTHDMRSVASRASRVVLLGEGQVRLDGPVGRVFARVQELARWGVLPPPLARLQSALLGDAADEVLLTVESLVAAVTPYAPAGMREAPACRGAGSVLPA